MISGKLCNSEESLRKILKTLTMASKFPAGAFKDKDGRERNFCFVSVFRETEEMEGKLGGKLIKVLFCFAPINVLFPSRFATKICTSDANDLKLSQASQFLVQLPKLLGA